MKSHKHTKISRQKVPNLIHNAERQKAENVAFPKFFTKIQNSFKLLEEPPPKEQVKAIKRDSFIHYHNRLSPRMKSLSQPKQRAASLPQRDIKSSCQSIAEDRSSAKKYKFNTLPRVEGGFLNKNEYRSFHKPSYSLHLNQRKYKQQKIKPEFQTIASISINGKDYNQLIQQKQREETLKMESIELESSSDESEIKAETQEKKQSIQILEILQGEEQANLHGFKQITQQIIAGQPKLYEAYDRKLMEKIRIYRPKKFKFDHQFIWK